MSSHALTADVLSRRAVDSSAWRRGFAFVFESRLALWTMTAVFAAAGLVLVLGHLIVDDEGLLTYVFARWLALAPVPVFFFQKVKPVTCLIFALPSLGGARTVLAVHVALAALVAPMIAAVARTLGIRLPNLAALIVLVSPLFLFGAAAGISNVDGIVATSLFLYLAITKRWYWLAGFVLGCIPWVRSELAPFSLLLWLYVTAIERNRAMALGALIFPLLYWISGGVYHHDALWLIHFAPATAFPMPDNPIWPETSLRYLLATQLLVTPAVGFAVAARPSRLSSFERALYVFAWTSFLLVTFLPFLRLGNFGPTARYSLQPLPVLALLAARVIDPYLQGSRASSWRFWLVAVGLIAAWRVSHGPPEAVALPILAAYVAAALLASLGWGRAMACAVALAACVGLATPRSDLTLPAYYNAALGWLNDHARDVGAATIYTNSGELPVGIASSSRLADRDVRFIVAPDIEWELIELSNPANGQRDTILRVAAAELFGRSVLWHALSPDSIPPQSLFVLRRDPRLRLSLPEATWANRLQEIAGSEDFTIDRLVPAGASTAPEPPAADGGR